MNVLVGTSFALVLLLAVGIEMVLLTWPGIIPVHERTLSDFLTKAAWYVLHVTAYGLVLTPLAIGIIHHVLRGDVTQRYWLNLANPQVRRFAGFAIGLHALVFAVVLWSGVTFMYTFASPNWTGTFLSVFLPILVTWILVVSSVVIAAIIVVRTVILFPAIAIDGPRAAWTNALLDTKGHSWRVFFILLFAILPVSLLSSAFGYFSSAAGASPVAKWIHVAIDCVIVVASICVQAAIASRVYQVWANKLGRPTGLKPVDAQR